MRIRNKLLLAVFGVSLLTLGVSFWGIYAIADKTLESFRELGGEALPGSIAMARMSAEFYHAEFLVHEYDHEQSQELRQQIEKSLANLAGHETAHALHHRDEALNADVEMLVQGFNREIAQYLLLVQRGASRDELEKAFSRIHLLVRKFSERVLPYIEHDIARNYRQIAEVERMGHEARQQWLLNVVSILLFTLVLSLYLAKILSQPLRDLSEAARQIGDGKFYLRVPVTSTDEFGELAKTFNEMASRLENTHGELIAANLHLQDDIKEKQRLAEELELHRQNLERLVAERTSALAEREQRLAETQRIAHLGSWQFDLALHRLIWSDETFRIAGMSVCNTAPTPEEYLATVHPEDLPALQACIARAVSQHVPYEIEIRHRRPDGSYNVTFTRGHPVVENGQVVELVGSVLDIAARKAAEQALVDAMHAAETANIAKSAFLANMSHEIRTPLNGILGMAHLIRREGLNDQQVKRMDTLQTSSEHLLNIINAILELSKIEAGKFTLEENEVKIESLVANIASILQERLQARHIKLRTEIGVLPDSLLGDATRIQQALLNYAGNAVKFTEHGSITLRVRLLGEADASALIRFEVQDSGIGIAPEALTRLFSAFEQADSTSTRKYGGTGLGVAITRKIAQLMGGDAGAESEPGVGSTFWFTVRLKKGRVQKASAESSLPEMAEEMLKRDFSG
ncbi:MAG: ATP-binding protein, partial [Gallionella sp.]|nr:ATP-binding protein [Gallionella sp.]